MGDVSDGYHTFNELYKHRAALFACLCACNPSMAWKTRQHEDGTMFDGMFLAGMTLPGVGDVSYHVENDCWDMFRDVREIPCAPPFEGYFSDDVIDRLLAYFTGDDYERLKERRANTRDGYDTKGWRSMTEQMIGPVVISVGNEAEGVPPLKIDTPIPATEFIKHCTDWMQDIACYASEGRYMIAVDALLNIIIQLGNALDIDTTGLTVACELCQP